MTLATGFIIGIGANDGFNFNPSVPYAACRICGRVYQDEVHERRTLWQFRHARTHADSEHMALKLSGRWATPEAAAVLAPFGLFSIEDLVLDPETIHALGTAPRAPHDDAEFPTKPQILVPRSTTTP